MVIKGIIVQHTNTNSDFAIPCLICNEAVSISEFEQDRINRGLSINSKVCERCKQAILYARRMMENQGD